MQLQVFCYDYTSLILNAITDIFYTAGVDYTTTTDTSLQISLASRRVCFNVPIIFDNIIDDGEVFGVTLTTTSPIATVQVISSAVVTIIDVAIG